MRVPGWVFFIGSMLVLVSMTLLCSVLSYSTMRGVVIDAQDQGVDVPTLPDLVSFLVNGAEDAEPGDPLGDLMAMRPAATITPQPGPTETPPSGVTFTPEPTPDPATIQSVETEDEPDPFEDFQITDPRRRTILLMGIDQRTAVDAENAYRTDTMMLVQVDPVNRRIGVLSIPRDLWVNIPGFNQGRITTANYRGDLAALPGGGPGLAMETVRANLGVPVDKYVRINFEVFFRVAETIAPDGVEMCIEEPILDEKYPDEGYGFMVVRFDPGCQTLDSERLLQYARTRATQGGDFDRNRRQQEVLKALQAEVLSMDGIRNLLTQIPTLYTQLAGSYTTNLSVEEILDLANLVSRIPQENITFAQIGTLDVDFDTTEDGQQILLPRQSRISFVVQQAFNPPQDLTLGDLRARAEAENARIVVYNNTTTAGLAGNTRDWLTSEGVTVAGVGNIDPPGNAEEIIIRDYTGKPWTARYLAELMGLPQDAIRPGSDGLTSADVMVVVGTNIQRLLGGE